MRWYSKFVLRRAGIVLILGTLLSVWGGYYSIQLYKNLRTDIRELLPTTARSVVDLKEVSQRLESIENLAVLIFSKNPKASKKFVSDLAAKLEKAPKDVISSVEYKIERELQFFKDRQALFLDLKDLIQIKNYIRDRIDYETSLYNPLSILGNSDLPEPSINLPAIRAKYESKAGRYSHFPDSFYATPDESKRALLVNMPGTASGFEAQKELRNTVDRAIAELNPASYSPDIQIHFTGGVQDSLEEQEALVEDLELSTVVVTVIVTAGMLLFYRAIRATFALLISLFMGTFWTFGLSYFLVGYLNANSAFLGSIVIGNGINFGIIFLARYLEERRRHGLADLEANQIAIQHTATSTWTAALGAGLSYGSLMLTGFRGFNQFGVIGLIGMVLCWISAYSVLPALLTVLDRMKPLVRKDKKLPKGGLAAGLAFCVEKVPRGIWYVSLGVTVASIVMLSRFNLNSVLETDLSKLRNRDSLSHGAAFYSKDLDDIFQHYLSPMVILPKSHENALKVVEVLRKKQREEGEGTLLASIQTLDDFIPADQPQKIKTLKEIQKLLPPKILRRVPPADRKVINEFLTEKVMVPIQKQDLPPLILSKFTEKDGSIGKMVLVEPPLNNELSKGETLIQFIEELRALTDSVEPGAPVAGTLAISSDMIRAITYDGPRATLFALIAVTLLVVLLFRNVKTISLVLFSLFIGVIWLGGLIMGLKLKINFLNFIALPITFGIGVDYGVNIFHRYRETGGKDILDVIKNTGSAVGLCSFSTVVGYASLLIARNQGFVSFGILAVAGEMTCVIAAVISLPAYLTQREVLK